MPYKGHQKSSHHGEGTGPLTLRFKGNVVHVDHLGRVHLLEDRGVLLLHDRPPHLQRRRQLFRVAGKVAGKNGELLHARRRRRTHVPVLVDLHDGRRDLVAEGRVAHRLRDGRRVRHVLRTAGKLLRARLLTRGAHGRQRDEGHVVLALVADHHHVADHAALSAQRLLDGALDGDGCNVLASRRDDQLLVPARDPVHATRVHGALVAGVQPAEAVDSVVVLAFELGHVLLAQVRVDHVAHHHTAPAEAQLALVLLGRLVELRRGARRCLRVDPGRLLLHDGHLGAAERIATRSRDVRGVGGHRGSTRALRHAVAVVDGEAKLAEEVKGAHLDGCSARHREDAVVQAQVVLHLLVH
eukprot:Rhum_TRINITY_DN10610_c0_g1::Rhum_TRINITY_DN10610_c0_g1_i1::g.39330::m.39330